MRPVGDDSQGVQTAVIRDESLWFIPQGIEPSMFPQDASPSLGVLGRYAGDALVVTVKLLCDGDGSDTL